jgi:hypothetical protein
MKKTDFIKHRIKVLDEYREKNNNRAKEYAFSLPADNAAKLDFCIEHMGYDNLQDLMLFVSESFFDDALHASIMKKGGVEVKSIKDLFEKLFGDD